MSIVITAWDKSVGIAVCDGRAIDSEKNPVHEDHSKLSRLPNGGILGITGGLREGHTTTTLTGMVTEPLRRDIHAIDGTFPEVCEGIGRLLAEYRVRYPELAFGVSLIGNDGGIIRSASWTSVGEMDRYAPDEDVDTSATVLGLSAAANAESAKLIREYMAGVPRNFIDLADTYRAFKRIIQDVSQRHVELNDHVYCECIAAPGERDVLDWRTLFADGSSLTTASRVLFSPASVTAPTTIAYADTAIPGLAWATTVASTADVYLITGSFEMFVGAGSNVAASFQCSVYDGTTKLTPTIQFFWTPPAVGSGSTGFNVQFMTSITGLSGGAHTLRVYMANIQNINPFWIASGSNAICQRTF